MDTKGPSEIFITSTPPTPDPSQPSQSATSATVTVSPDPSSNSETANSETATAIGAGVGVPLGTLGLGLLAFLFWRHRRKTANKNLLMANWSSARWRQQEQPKTTTEWQNAAASRGWWEMSAETRPQEMSPGNAWSTQELDSRHQ